MTYFIQNMSSESRRWVAIAFIAAALGFGIIQKAFGEVTLSTHTVKQWGNDISLSAEIESHTVDPKEVIPWIINKDIPLSNKKWNFNKEGNYATVWHLLDNDVVEEMTLTGMDAVQFAVILPKEVRQKMCSDWMIEQAEKLEYTLYGNSSNKK